MFVPGFEQDVFISYSHLDDKPLRDGQLGWVRRLKEALEREVGQRLGAPAFRIWMDPQIAGNVPLTTELVGKLRASATLVIVMSPSYVASEWCRRERNAFLQLARECVRDGRIFVVRCREPDRKDVPPEFGELLGYPFWTKDAQTGIERCLGALDPPEQEYWDQVIRLSAQLAGKLKALKAAGDGRAAEAAPAVSVFVARSTDDLGDREEELKGYLEQQSIAVLPQTWYPTNDPDAFRTAMEADLRRCKVFAQLVSATPGRKVQPGAELRYPVLQHACAAERTDPGPIPILLWRPAERDVREVEDAQHRSLLERARACGFEEFKRAVMDEVRRVPAATRREPLSLAAFVDADPRDRGLADQVGNLLQREGIDTILPALEGPPEEIRKDFEQNLIDCDGLLLVYGSSEPLWVRSQLAQIRKVSTQRAKPFAVLALFMGPPPQKGELGLKLPNVVTVDCREGLRPEALRDFAQALRRSTEVRA